MATYHIPYAPRHRYWTGMLLLARAILYLIAAANVSGDPQLQLISVIFVITAIIFLKMFIAARIFKNSLVDILDSFFYVNILFFASFTAYNLSTGNNQDGVAYTSVTLSILVTIFIIFYHIHEYTSLFSRFYLNKCVKKFKKRFELSPKEHIEEHTNQITDASVGRFDDILDLADLTTIRETEYYDADSRSIPQKPTFSEVTFE